MPASGIGPHKAYATVLRPNLPPPPHYYADNLTRLLDTVATQYSDILETAERDRLLRIMKLGTEALRLYARLLTRKGPILRLDKLAYREVRDTPAAARELVYAGLVEWSPAGPADQVLAVMTVTELKDAFRRVPGIRSLRKDLLVARLAARYPERVLHGRLARFGPWLTLTEPDWLTAMRVLFFGGMRQDTSTFVLEDLGVVRHEAYRLDPDRRLFAERTELARYLELRRLRLSELRGRWSTERASAYVEQLWNDDANRLVERQRGRLLNGIGREAERRGAFDLALTAYARTQQEPARERRVRILHRLGDRQGAGDLLRQIQRAPGSAGERHFADQFGPRTGIAATSRVGGLKRIDERRLRLTEAPQSVEAAALNAWTRNGGSGAHLENRLSLGLLGLAFWEVVFAPIAGMFTHPYQDGPLDLYWPDFRATRRSLIEDRFQEFERPGALADRMRMTFRAKHGISNALVSWGSLDEVLLTRIIDAIPADHLCAMFDFMLDDLQQTRTGFPDLLVVYGRNAYRLVEVKGPGDQLRREQKLWFELFLRIGMPATVLRVAWS